MVLKKLLDQNLTSNDNILAHFPMNTLNITDIIND